MICNVYDSTGTRQVRVEDREPECGEDYCEHCGDCLRCFGGMECVHSETGLHLWIVHEPSNAEA